MIKFKYSGLELEPTTMTSPAGVLLVGDDRARSRRRLFFVDAEGVRELPENAGRGELALDVAIAAAPLIDCGELTLLKVKAHQGDAGAAEAVKKIEVERRAKMLENAANSAVELALRQIAAADSKKGEVKP